MVQMALTATLRASPVPESLHPMFSPEGIRRPWIRGEWTGGQVDTRRPSEPLTDFRLVSSCASSSVPSRIRGDLHATRCPHVHASTCHERSCG